MADRETITVYVRLGPNDNEYQRTLTFKRPGRVPSSELLELGLAIDGNQVVSCVSPRVDDEGFTGPLQDAYSCPTLMDALREEEKTLIAWLDGHGYDVEFG